MIELPQYVCPQHRLPLEDRFQSLECTEGCSYPVREEIPRFVPAESYASAFGAQWLHYRQTQLDSYTGVTISEDRLRRCVGEELWARLPGMKVLEAGCGAGRFTEVLLKRGALLTSVDLSVAVDANRQNFPVSPKHRIAQADITRLPFSPGGYDLVVCLGVIQHTPHPELTISRLAEQVAPGGWLVIDHYAPTLGYYLRLTPLFRAVLKRLKPEHTIPISERLVNFFLPLHRALRRSSFGSLLLGRISPVMEYYTTIPELCDAHQREWAMLDTHDSLTDWYKHFRDERQVRKALERLGMQEIWCNKGGNGVEARARASREGSDVKV